MMMNHFIEQAKLKYFPYSVNKTKGREEKEIFKPEQESKKVGIPMEIISPFITSMLCCASYWLWASLYMT